MCMRCRTIGIFGFIGRAVALFRLKPNFSGNELRDEKSDKSHRGEAEIETPKCPCNYLFNAVEFTRNGQILGVLWPSDRRVYFG